jgi:predicted nucleotide-binding protein
MARKTQPPTKQLAKLTSQEMRRGIDLLNRRLNELRSFDPNTINDQFHHPNLDALGTRIAETLVRVFGADTLDHDRYSHAQYFNTGPIYMGGSGSPVSTVRQEVQESKERNIALLESAVHSLEEQLADSAGEETAPTPSMAPISRARSVFVVHGHDDAAKQAVARVLERLDFAAIVLHEQPSQGRTVIEKFEAHADVGFAVIILTPDDVCTSGETTTTRARQNVILELGYFVGRLGRARVLALKKGDVELPSDYVGVVWTEFDARGAWRTELAQELQAAGYEINWQKFMGN